MSTSVMVTDKEKQIQPTGSQYRYHHTQTEEARSDLKCCQEHETTMEKYMFVTGVLFTLFLGPYCGVQIVMAAQEENLFVSGVPTAILFLCSFLMSLCPSKQRRMVCRLWTLVGFVWISCGWVVWFKKDFTESPQDWMIVALIQTVAFGVFGLPVFLTDPFIWIY